MCVAGASPWWWRGALARRSYEEKIGTPTCPVRVIHNGLHEAEFEPVPRGSESYDFAFVGEMRTLKGIDVLIDAVKELADRREVSVLLVGSGPDEERIRARVRELGLSRSVAMSPAIRPARSAFEMARCVVIPSLAESLPYIVLEVLASEVPLLVTGVGGIPEIFGPHASGLLPPGDAPALTRAMLDFLDDPDRASERASLIREQLRSHVRVSQMVDATLELYGATAENVAPVRTATPR